MSVHALNPWDCQQFDIKSWLEAATPQRAAPLPRAAAPAQTTNLVAWKKVARHRMGLALGLRPGWDGSTSSPVSRSLGLKAMNFLEFALASQTEPEAPFIVPRADGGIQLEWHTKSVEIEVYFEPEGDVSAWATDRDTGYEIEVEDGETLPLLIRWAPRLAHRDLYMAEERLQAHAA